MYTHLNSGDDAGKIWSGALKPIIGTAKPLVGFARRHAANGERESALIGSMSRPSAAVIRRKRTSATVCASNRVNVNRAWTAIPKTAAETRHAKPSSRLGAFVISVALACETLERAIREHIEAHQTSAAAGPIVAGQRPRGHHCPSKCAR